MFEEAHQDGLRLQFVSLRSLCCVLSCREIISFFFLSFCIFYFFLISILLVGILLG